jgi:hypothetical protein
MITAEQIHRQAIREDISVIAESLQEIIGQRLAAYGAAIKDPKQIGRFAKGTRTPGEATAGRLREVYKVVQILSSEETPETVRAFLIGSNPQLDNEAPIEVLHHNQPARALSAAEAFIVGG